MKRKVLLLTVTLLLVLGVAQVASAAGFGFGGGPHMFKGDWTGPVDALNLTDQQLEKMKKMNDEHYAQSREIRIQLMDKMHELRQLQLQKNPDETAIEAKKKEITELRENLWNIVQQHREKCRALLTDEQLKQLEELKGKTGRGFRGGFGTGPGTGNVQ